MECVESVEVNATEEPATACKHKATGKRFSRVQKRRTGDCSTGGIVVKKEPGESVEVIATEVVTEPAALFKHKATGKRSTRLRRVS